MSFLFFLALVSARTDLYSEKIEVQVGEQIITSTDIRLTMERLQQFASEKKSDETVRRKAVDLEIEQALTRNYLKQLQMDVSDQEVERRINSIRAAQGASTVEEFRGLLEAQGLSFDQFRKQVRDQLQNMQFEQIIQRQVLQTTDEKELKSFYQNHIDRFSKNHELELQECLIPVAADEEKIKALANQFIQKKRAFSECVSKFSRSPSAERNGDLGKVQMGLLRKAVEDKVFAAKVNEVVLVELPGAIQLLRVQSRKDLGPRSFEDVKSEIRSEIEQERVARAKEKLIADLKAATFIRIDS